MIDPREEALFERALDLEPSARAAFLARECADDPDLKARVETLLRLDQSTVGVLDADPLTLDPDAVSMGAPLQSGDTIDGYTLVEEIGTGGMGVVYLAEQTSPVRREVALKVIKPGMDTRSIIARFEAERQALALLDHPSITKVLDAGSTANGRPYFVMELCRGVGITEYARERDLSLDARLELFERVCHGIEHAHQKGLLHRDLKPSNVLVPEEEESPGLPHPKIIDFGVAKALTSSLTGETLVTMHGQVIGTPEYISPEQCENSLDVDTRSDVYSLGVILFELLTGTTPTSALDIPRAQLLNAIPDLDTPPPSTVLRRQETPPIDPRETQGELDWIVARALAKDRTRRYQSAADLARDIASYRRGDPIEAAAPTLRYRASKAYRRHRVAVLSGSAISLVLIVATIVSTLLAFRLDDSLTEMKVQRDRAIEAEQKLATLEREQRNRAAVYRGLARYAGETMIEHLGTLNRGETVTRPDLSKILDQLPRNEDGTLVLRGDWGDLNDLDGIDGLDRIMDMDFDGETFGRPIDFEATLTPILEFVHSLDGLEILDLPQGQASAMIQIGVSGSFDAFPDFTTIDWSADFDPSEFMEFLPEDAIEVIREEQERAFSGVGPELDKTLEFLETDNAPSPSAPAEKKDASSASESP